MGAISKVEGLTATHAALKLQVNDLRDRLDAKTGECKSAKDKCVADRNEIIRLQDAYAAAESEIDRLKKLFFDRSEELNAIRRSSSWRLTAPLRWLSGTFPSAARFGKIPLRAVARPWRSAQFLLRKSQPNRPLVQPASSPLEYSHQIEQPAGIEKQRRQRMAGR